MEPGRGLHHQPLGTLKATWLLQRLKRRLKLRLGHVFAGHRRRSYGAEAREFTNLGEPPRDGGRALGARRHAPVHFGARHLHPHKPTEEARCPLLN